MDDDAAAWANEVRQVAVIGAGTMGEGIVQGFAEAGIAVRLVDPSVAQLDRCRRAIATNVALARAEGLAGDSYEAICGRITVSAAGHPETLSSCALVIETVPEVLDLKRRLFADYDALPDDVVIASNTGSITMSQITEGLSTQSRMVGVHYFNPAHLIPAVELHRAPGTTDRSLARVRALMQRIGKTPFVVEKSVPGLVINRLTAALMREIGWLLDEGVISPRDLDAGVKASIGFRLAWVGPMEGSDFTGLDIGARVQTALLPTLSNRDGPFQQLLDHVAQGELGVKSGRGWYDYPRGEAERITEARNRRLIAQAKLVKDLKA